MHIGLGLIWTVHHYLADVSGDKAKHRVDMEVRYDLPFPLSPPYLRLLSKKTIISFPLPPKKTPSFLTLLFHSLSFKLWKAIQRHWLESAYSWAGVALSSLFSMPKHLSSLIQQPSSAAMFQNILESMVNE